MLNCMFRGELSKSEEQMENSDRQINKGTEYNNFSQSPPPGKKCYDKFHYYKTFIVFHTPKVLPFLAGCALFLTMQHGAQPV